MLLTPGIVVVEHGLCGCGGELAHAGAERGEDGGDDDASGLGEVVAVGASELGNEAEHSRTWAVGVTRWQPSTSTRSRSPTHHAGRPRFWTVQRGMVQHFGEPEWHRVERAQVEAWIGEALPEPACTYQAGQAC